MKMKMKYLKRTLCLILCNVLFFASVLSQELDALGPMRFSSPPAPELRNPTRINLPKPGGGLRPLRLSFLSRVGGVAFDGVAKPTNGLVVNNIKLDYLPTKKDGERLSMTLNGQKTAVQIYDWQLIPIAKFADSEFYSCVTLFGELENKVEQAEVRTHFAKCCID